VTGEQGWRDWNCVGDSQLDWGSVVAVSS